MKCSKCNSELLGSKRCTKCAKEYCAEYYQRNKEKIKAQARAYYAENREVVIARNSRSTPERLERVKNWRINYPEKVKAQRNRWVENNPDRAREIRNIWASANPESAANRRNRRRLKVASNGGKLSKGLKSRLFDLQCGKCACCGKPLGNDYHMDHIMPIALGGLNEDFNIQLLRSLCNIQKRDKHPIKFMQERGCLL